MPFPEVVGATEIAAMLNVTRQRIQQLAGTGDFPAPVAELKMGKLWLVEDIEAWADAHGRVIHPLTE